MAIFVSYRRSDASGHAGRLCDDLGDRLGADQVFHDVEAIRPGEDYLVAIERALATADVVLVVIGRDWADARDAAGSRRLDDPADVVRTEVATALRSPPPVVPVLVGGATMPTAAQLPAALAGLARRNALALRAEAWDDDLGRLLRAITPLIEAGSPAPPRGHPAAPAPPEDAARPSSRVRRVGAFAIAGIAVLAAGVLLWPRAGEAPASTTAVPAVGVGSTPSVAANGGPEAAASPGTPVPLPAVAATIVHPLGRDAVLVTLEELTLRGAAGESRAHLVLRVDNQDDSEVYLDPADVQLVVDGAAVNPLDQFGTVLGARAATTVERDYVLPGSATAEDLAVRIDVGGIVAEIPFGSSEGEGDAAALDLVNDVETIDLGATTFDVGPPGQERYSDRVLVRVPVRATNHDDVATNFWDNDFRLVIDGDSTEPIGTRLNELLEGRSTKRATLVWEVPLGDHDLLLTVDHDQEHADVPMSRPSD